MIRVENLPIRIQPNDGPSTAGVLYVANFDNQERLKRAAIMWGSCWLFAVLSVPVIIAHWILVPGFLLAGPIMGLRRYKVVSAIERVDGICPVCKASVIVPMEADDTLPKRTYCPKCSGPIQLLAEEPTPN